MLIKKSLLLFLSLLMLIIALISKFFYLLHFIFEYPLIKFKNYCKQQLTNKNA